MRWTALTLVSAALALAAVTVTGASGKDERAPLDTAAAAPRPAPNSGLQVVSPSREVLAEMDRRVGTPRRVLIAYRKRARQIARLERKLARLRAAQRAEAERRLAALRAAQAAIWSDPGAASMLSRGPNSAAEAQWLASGRGGWVESTGYSRPPANAPDAIRRVVLAGNQIARAPYLWGGGHGAWRDRGYDCSGSVSYALAAGGMLGSTQTSGQLMSWGEPGPGRWLTVYASPTHVFLVAAGLRFDTSGRAGDHASRWQLSPRSADGFAVRHYPGL